jgi:hypothetical protein
MMRLGAARTQPGYSVAPPVGAARGSRWRSAARAPAAAERAEARPVMSAPRPPSVTRTLLERVRAGKRLRYAPILLLVAVAHPTATFLSDGLVAHSVPGTLVLTLLTVLTLGTVLMRPTTDYFELFRAMSFYYFLAFGVAPVVVPDDLPWVYYTPKSKLVLQAALLSLFAWLSMAVGYHLPFFRRIPRRVDLAQHSIQSSRAAFLGLALFAVGVVGFVVLFISAGGAAVIIEGQGGRARNEFTVGLGWFFWFTLFMLPGGACYFAARAGANPRRAIIHAWPLVVAFLCLLLLQGRHRALGPMIMAFVISNYLVRRTRLSRLILVGVIGLTLSIVVGVVRSPSLRPLFAADPIGVTIMIFEDYPERVRNILTVDMSRIAEIMIVIDNVPERTPYRWGNSLLIPTSPFLRLAGLHRYQPENVGYDLYELARPGEQRLVRTGFLPSIVGEMRANFPWWLCVVPYMLYGVLLRVIYTSLIVRRGDALAVAGYALLGLAFSNMVIGTFAQNLFEHMVVFLPVLAIRFLCLSPRPPGTSRALSEDAGGAVSPVAGR